MFNFHTNTWQKGYEQAELDFKKVQAKYKVACPLDVVKRIEAVPFLMFGKSQDFQMGYEAYLDKVTQDVVNTPSFTTFLDDIRRDFITKPQVPRPPIELDDREQAGYQVAESLYHTWFNQGASLEEAHGRLVAERRIRTSSFAMSVGYAKFTSELAQRVELEYCFKATAEEYPESEGING